VTDITLLGDCDRVVTRICKMLGWSLDDSWETGPDERFRPFRENLVEAPQRSLLHSSQAELDASMGDDGYYDSNEFVPSSSDDDDSEYSED